MSTIKIPYTHPPIHDPRPTPQNKKFATLMGRMLEAHIRQWCSTHHTHTPGTITLHYQPLHPEPDDKLRLALTNRLLNQVARTMYPTATVETPQLHPPGRNPHPVWLDITPRKAQP
ncbi:hypothetical protein [Corynebacterium kroppenstedtii]|uniref:hypothetical protein n=1 Tax=Corynebacterium kroppenstedtii TaxID=161879 RepID=UPI003872C3DE